MNETQYINDDFGNKIPLLDNSGNLSLQVIMLYTEDKLTGADRKIVDDFASQDEFTRDALDGFALTSNASKTRFAVGELNSSIQKRTGAKAVSPLVPQEKSEFDFRKLAAAITILVILGGTTFFATQFFKDEEMALQEKTIEEPVKQDYKNKGAQDLESATIQLDTIISQFQGQDKVKVAETDLLKSPEEPKEVAERTSETKVSEKPALDLLEMKDLQGSSEDVEQESLADLAVEDADGLEMEETSNGMLGNIDDVTLNEVVAIEEPATPVLEQKKEADFVEEEIAEETNRKEREALAKASAMMEAERQKAEERAMYASEQEAARKAAASSMAQAERIAEEQAVKLADQSAKFPGGDIKMYRFIERKKNYTQAMKNQGLSGNVTISFDIEVDGRITNAKVKTGVAGLLDEDALRIVRSMPKWEPAIRGGSQIRSSRSVVVKYGD